MSIFKIEKKKIDFRTVKCLLFFICYLLLRESFNFENLKVILMLKVLVQQRISTTYKKNLNNILSIKKNIKR